MKIVFLGSGAFGLPTLETLAKLHTVTGVVTQPDRPAGRGSKLTATPIGAWSAEHLPGVPVLKPERVNESSARATVRSWEADAWVVIAFGQKLGQELLSDRFAINLHASLLPRWRGAAPINHSILAGEEETGNSVITLAERMDAGLILGQSTRRIGDFQTAGELHDLLAQDGPALVEQVLSQHERRVLEPHSQDESLVTVAGKLSKEDRWVDFTQPGRMCARRVNGLSPWPGVVVGHAGTDLKLVRAEPGADQSEQGAPGEIIDAGLGTIACGEGTSVRILEVQPVGKKAMTWEAYANGRSVQAGDRLVGRESAGC